MRHRRGVCPVDNSWSESCTAWAPRPEHPHRRYRGRKDPRWAFGQTIFRQLRVASVNAEERRPLGCAKEVGRETRESVEPVAGADPQITQAYRDGQRAWLRRETREAGPAGRRRRPHIRRTKLK